MGQEWLAEEDDRVKEPTEAPGTSTAPTVADTPVAGTQPPATPTQAPPAATPGALAAPALKAGTLEEAAEATGMSISLPTYLPAGAEREEDVVRYYAHEGGGYASVGYRVGSAHLAVSYTKTAAGEMPPSEGEPVTVGTFEAVLRTQPREPSDPSPPISELEWRDGDVLVRVSGDLPVAELLKVADSLYR